MLIKDLYTVQSFEQNETGVTATIQIHKEHEVFKGHFPGNPVMPGVCMIQIIKELTEKATRKELFLSVSSNIKFMAIINPEKNDVLVLNLIISEIDGDIKVKNTTFFEDTLALKLNATFKITA
ncbi:Beta-hydroxyacyl-(acyl-carrier-protein) dehydratase, FabA/FabZ [hydrothermal vent metagenome]|uniref:Beta-hydroxyacyl-(Acyl-carrier-protein) dehydratase, FabA/FabZ n=1 Tax=hydrothermal vent metagenome TaxID=652676 RepID=A0A3B0T4R9_9ZZZZ